MATTVCDDDWRRYTSRACSDLCWRPPTEAYHFHKFEYDDACDACAKVAAAYAHEHGARFRSVNVAGAEWLCDATFERFTALEQLRIDCCLGENLTAAALSHLPHPHLLQHLHIENSFFFDEHTLAPIAVHGTLVHLTLCQLRVLTDASFVGRWDALQYLELADFELSAYRALTLAPFLRMPRLELVDIRMHMLGDFDLDTADGRRAAQTAETATVQTAWMQRYSCLGHMPDAEELVDPWPHMRKLYLDCGKFGPDASDDDESDDQYVDEWIGSRSA